VSAYLFMCFSKTRMTTLSYCTQ